MRNFIARYLATAPDQQFPIAWSTHNTTTDNMAFHSRVRRSDYTEHDQFYLQWWNYIIYDAETHNHYNFAYMVRFRFGFSPPLWL